MKTRVLASILLGAAAFPPIGLAQDLSYFEEKYQTKLDGIAPRSEHKDLDHYYAEIAKRLGIPGIAFSAVSEKYGWKKEDGKVFGGIVRRSEDKWKVLVYQIPQKVNSPDTDTYAQRFVEIDDAKRVLYCGEEQPK